MIDARDGSSHDWLNTQGRLSEFPIFVESVEKRRDQKKYCYGA